MLISILSSDISSNSFGRVWLLAKLLCRYYNVEVLGPAFGDGIWPPGRDISPICKTYPGHRFPIFFRTMKSIISDIKGDVIYACKPYSSSYLPGLLKKAASGIPTVLDVDDWDSRMIWEHERNLFIVSRKVRHPNTFWHAWFLEKFTWLSDNITVSSNFLARRYKAIKIPHARDTSFLDPDKYDRNELRKRWGVKDDEKVFIFLGTPRPHKGLENLIQAVKLLARSDIKLWLVGGTDNKWFMQNLRDLGGDTVRFFGYCSLVETPEFLSAADIVVLPQLVSLANTAQVPAKLFDAMAMGKPIIATGVSDIPEILSDCGLVVESDSVEALHSELCYALEHTVEITNLGYKAREKCIRYFSYDSVAPILASIFSKFA